MGWRFSMRTGWPSMAARWSCWWRARARARWMLPWIRLRAEEKASGCDQTRNLSQFRRARLGNRRRTHGHPHAIPRGRKKAASLRRAGQRAPRCSIPFTSPRRSSNARWKSTHSRSANTFPAAVFRSWTRPRPQPPDAYLLLAWNFLRDSWPGRKDYIVAGGEFIVPIPRPVVINQANYARFA